MEEMFDIFLDMANDFDTNYTEEDYYNKFEEICGQYNDHSLEPYYLFCLLFEEEIPMESYYLQALMDVYSMYTVDDTFLDTLQAVIETNYCNAYIESTHQSLKDYVNDGYITAYRGEYATDNNGNLDYKESVSYSLNFEQAVFFATRFKNVLSLTKSVVYTVKVPIGDVIAYIDREEEVVCLPICAGGKMKVIKEENYL